MKRMLAVTCVIAIVTMFVVVPFVPNFPDSPVPFLQPATCHLQPSSSSSAVDSSTFILNAPIPVFQSATGQEITVNHQSFFIDANDFYMNGLDNFDRTLLGNLKVAGGDTGIDISPDRHHATLKNGQTVYYGVKIAPEDREKVRGVTFILVTTPKSGIPNIRDNYFEIKYVESVGGSPGSVKNDSTAGKAYQVINPNGDYWYYFSFKAVVKSGGILTEITPVFFGGPKVVATAEKYIVCCWEQITTPLLDVPKCIPISWWYCFPIIDLRAIWAFQCALYKKIAANTASVACTNPEATGKTLTILGSGFNALKDTPLAQAIHVTDEAGQAATVTSASVVSDNEIATTIDVDRCLPGQKCVTIDGAQGHGNVTFIEVINDMPVTPLGQTAFCAAVVRGTCDKVPLTLTTTGEHVQFYTGILNVFNVTKTTTCTPTQVSFFTCGNPVNTGSYIVKGTATPGTQMISEYLGEISDDNLVTGSKYCTNMPEPRCKTYIQPATGVDIVKWLPQGNLQDEKMNGNTMIFEVWWDWALAPGESAPRTTKTIEVFLGDVLGKYEEYLDPKTAKKSTTNLKGACSNSGSLTLPDFLFEETKNTALWIIEKDAIAEIAGNQAMKMKTKVARAAKEKIKVVVSSYDYGGRTTIWAKAEACDESETIQAPKDTDFDLMPDAWEDEMNQNKPKGAPGKDLPNLDKNKADADRDDDHNKSGIIGGGAGDRLPALDEYRGFSVSRGHLRTNPFIKNVFIHFADDVPNDPYLATKKNDDGFNVDRSIGEPFDIRKNPAAMDADLSIWQIVEGEFDATGAERDEKHFITPKGDLNFNSPKPYKGIKQKCVRVITDPKPWDIGLYGKSVSTTTGGVPKGPNHIGSLRGGKVKSLPDFAGVIIFLGDIRGGVAFVEGDGIITESGGLPIAGGVLYRSPAKLPQPKDFPPIDQTYAVKKGKEIHPVYFFRKEDKIVWWDKDESGHWSRGDALWLSSKGVATFDSKRDFVIIRDLTAKIPDGQQERTKVLDNTTEFRYQDFAKVAGYQTGDTIFTTHFDRQMYINSRDNIIAHEVIGHPVEMQHHEVAETIMTATDQISANGFIPTSLDRYFDPPNKYAEISQKEIQLRE